MEEKKKYLYWLLGGIGLALCLFFFWQKVKSEPPSFAPRVASSVASSSLNEGEKKTNTTAEQPKQIYIDIKGAVRKPGMYAMQEGDRVYDAIQKAEGYTKQADEAAVDQAQKLSDQMTLLIPKKGQKHAVVRQPKGASASASKATTAEKISLNQATSEQLQTIDGIGEKKAQKIIQYRQEKGGFQSLDELKEITGFGEKTVAKLKEVLCL